jgi:endonuclease YncB( thermonuclease family)
MAVTTLCGYSVGTSVLKGTVTSVHDGDTLTLSTSSGTQSIRLDGIDAPELAQPYGPESRARLAAVVLNQPVTVAYSKSDQYGRIVGSVLTGSCQLANLAQLEAGAAWFYKAYQCELSASLRSLYAEAQTAASEARRGLWAAPDPEAPWIYRNGSEPATPSCSNDLPVIGSAAQSAAVTTVKTISSASSTPTVISTSSSKTCYVGPRGGTYTLTASGNKNYSGC